MKTFTLVMIQITSTMQNQESNQSHCRGISRSDKDVITYGWMSIRNKLEAEGAYPITEGTCMGDRWYEFKSL